VLKKMEIRTMRPVLELAEVLGSPASKLSPIQLPETGSSTRYSAWASPGFVDT